MADDLYEDVRKDSTKKEFRMSSEGSARPPATINSQPHYDNTTLKPKQRQVVSVTYSLTDEVVMPEKGTRQKPFKLVWVTKTFDDGVTIDYTVGEDNPDYQEYLKTGVAFTDRVPTSTRRLNPAKAQKVVPKAAKKAATKE